MACPSSRLAALLLVFLPFPAWCAAPMRAALNPLTLGGWMRAAPRDSAQAADLGEKRRHLRYYADLGFTHIVYHLDMTLLDGFVKEEGEWVYRGERLGFGPDSSFRAWQDEVRRAGMEMIPFIPSLSHMGPFIIWVDSAVSEFPSKAAFDSFCVAKGLPKNREIDHVASPVDNPGADQIFRALLEFVRANWDPRVDGGSGPQGPARVLIGHDELGYDSVSFIKAGKSRHRKEAAARLVADEILLRAAQIDSVLGPATEIHLFGDSFLPTDLGDQYRLAGHPATGAGGVLALLPPRLRKRFVIIPWNYTQAEGEVHHWSRRRFYRARQLALLDTLGYRYMPGTGEHGCGGAPDGFAPPFALGDPAAASRALFEWVKAAQARPARLAGWYHMTFERFDRCNPRAVCAGFTAPLLAWMAWTPGSPWAARPASLRGEDWTARLVEGVEYVRSRKERAWKAGVHYPAAPPRADTAGRTAPGAAGPGR